MATTSQPDSRRTQNGDPKANAIALRRAGHSAAETARIMGISRRHVQRLCAGADLSPSSAPEAATAARVRRQPQDPGSGRFRAGGTINRESLRRLNGLGRGPGNEPEEWLATPKNLDARAAFGSGLVRDPETRALYDPNDPRDCARIERLRA